MSEGRWSLEPSDNPNQLVLKSHGAAMNELMGKASTELTQIIMEHEEKLMLETVPIEALLRLKAAVENEIEQRQNKGK